MLVFSSELIIRSNGSSRSPCQYPSYRSRTTAAFSKKLAARGKIQCSYCQGLMASSSRMRQTVLRLMGLFSSSRARSARSVVDWRLNGFPVRATTSQAIETTTALSRGGKGRLAAPARIVLEGKLTSGPALPPTADGIGMKIKPSRGCHVGKRGGFVKEQDQACTLPEVRRCGARVEEASGLGEGLIREGRAMKWRRARHETIPGAVGEMVFSDDTPSIGRLQSSVTLPLFVKWTT